jgi:hypothetical protein
LPDNDRTWFTLGTQWKPAREQTLELGVAYLYIPNTKINQDETSTIRRRIAARSSATTIRASGFSVRNTRLPSDRTARSAKKAPDAGAFFCVLSSHPVIAMLLRVVAVDAWRRSV